MAEAIASSLEVVGDAAVRAKSAESGGPGPSTSLVPDAADGMARLRTSAMVLGRGHERDEPSRGTKGFRRNPQSADGV